MHGHIYKKFLIDSGKLKLSRIAFPQLEAFLF